MPSGELSTPFRASRFKAASHKVMPEARSFEHSQALGVSLQDARGWRINFGDAEALPEKVASLNVLLQQIAKRGDVVRLIDLRYVGSPYYE